jgi:hypothetical protein
MDPDVEVVQKGEQSSTRRWTTAENLVYFDKIVESLPEDGDTIKLMGEIFFHGEKVEEKQSTSTIIAPISSTSTGDTGVTANGGGGGSVISTILGKRDISQKIPRHRPVKEQNFRVIRPERDAMKRQRLDNEVAVLRLLMQLAEYALSGRAFHISEISRVVRASLGGNTVELRPVPSEFREVVRGDACLATFMRILLTHRPTAKHEDGWISSRYAVLYVAPHFFGPWHHPLWEGICSGDMEKFKKLVMENRVASPTDCCLAKLLSITTFVFDRKTN